MNFFCKMNDGRFLTDYRSSIRVNNELCNDTINNIQHIPNINKKIQFNYNNNYNKNKLIKCQVPSLTTSQCLLTQYNQCPQINGSYKQCTNNYIPNPSQKHCSCKNRTFEMCPYPFKISEKCYNH